MRCKVLQSLALIFVFIASATAQVSFTVSRYPTPGPSSGIITGDFNKDGFPDFAVTSGQDSGSQVTIYLGTGGGNFAFKGDFTVRAFPDDIVAADVNNDGKLDLILNYSNNGGNPGQADNVLTILYGNGDGTFRPGTELVRTKQIQTFAAGDFNRDGNLDLALSECDSGTCNIVFLKGNGAGVFTQTGTIVTTGLTNSDMIARDMNGDGFIDILVIRSNSVLLFGGNGAGGFNTFTKFTPPAVCTNPSTCSDFLSGLTVGDFNNDGKTDFAVNQAHGCGGSACGSNTVYVYKNTGGYTFSRSSFNIPATTISAGGELVASDLNGDQNIDLIVNNGAIRGGGVVYALGNGSGTFGTQGSVNIQEAELVARDVSLDSRHDLVGAAGIDFSAQAAINISAFTNCPPPKSGTMAAKICGPANNASVTSPVLVKGSGNSPAGIQRLEIWVDGVKKYQKWNDQVAKGISMAAGAHRVTIVAVDAYKGTAKASVTVTVH
jgi:hypothetical protein